MKVYVVESGSYEQRGIVGVYATPELAMGSCTGPWVKRYDRVLSNSDYWVDWQCDCGKCEGTEFHERELKDDGPVGVLARIEMQLPWGRSVEVTAEEAALLKVEPR